MRQRTEALEARNAELSRLRLALETANQRLKRLVAVDALTGIAKSAPLRSRPRTRAAARAPRRPPLSLIFLDLDEFKRFNDTYGHARGDEVLRRVAQTLDETFRRGGDLVARYGGEEFAVVLPGVDGDARRSMRSACAGASGARDSLRRLARHRPRHDQRRRRHGHADADDRCGRTNLLRAADTALYRAKCLGRNRIAVCRGLASVRSNCLEGSSAPMQTHRAHPTGDASSAALRRLSPVHCSHAHRRRRLPARNQYVRSAAGDACRLRSAGCLAGPDARPGTVRCGARHQSARSRFHRRGAARRVTRRAAHVVFGHAFGARHARCLRAHRRTAARGSARTSRRRCGLSRSARRDGRRAHR